MGTEMTASGRSVSLAPEIDGRPQDNGLYVQSASQAFYYGKRIITTFGRVFKYSYAKGALIGGYGAYNAFPVSKHITYAVLPVAITVGDLYATVTVAASLGYASTGFLQDELVGGFLVVGHNSANIENRCIVANDAVPTAGATMRIWVDGPFAKAHPVTDGAEAYPNPYMYLNSGAAGGGGTQQVNNAWMGVPATNIASAYSAFIQEGGPCWVTPGGSSGSTGGEAANDRTWWWNSDGSVIDYTTATASAGGVIGHQYAGWEIDTTAAATSGMPLIMLCNRQI